MHKKLIGLFCVALMVTIVGCGASKPPLTTVSGTVSYDGKPLDGATVSLTPDGGDGTQRPANGITDGDGNFTLTTVFPDGEIVDGAVEGNYTVRVTKLIESEMPEGDAGPPSEDQDPSAEMMAMMGGMDENGNPMINTAESLINEVFGLPYQISQAWQNKCAIGPVETAASLKITLSSSGTGTVE